MRATDPVALHAAVEDAFRRGDLDAYVGLHEEEAVLVIPPCGLVTHGREAIRAAMTDWLKQPQPLTSVVVRTLIAGDIALTRVRWTLDGVTPDGEPGNGTVVSRRRPDGTWAIVIDDTVGPGNETTRP